MPLDEKELLHKKELEDSQAALLNVLQDHKEEAERILKNKAIDEAILASIGDGLVVVDKEGKITYVNQAFEKMVGWKASQVAGKHFLEVVPREDEKGDIVPFNERILNKVLCGEVVVADLTNPFYYIRKDGSRFPTSSIVTSIVLDGEIIGVVETFRDITREKEIDKTKTEFVSLASHQLRTPLSTINWYTEMLLAGDVGKLNEQQEKYLDEVYRGNQRMISLVNALLSVSRMDLGTFIFEPEPTDIAILVRNVLDEQMPQIAQKDITLLPLFGKNLPLIQADPRLLRMVIQNLLSNAIKYNTENGEIAFSLTQSEDKKTLLFKIADKGYGIPESQKSRIFTKLFRADNVREKDTEGTGLGLYIAKSIVDNSGGKIWFESEEEVGTTFFVELPCEVVPEPPVYL
jgi:PAS domain S-box-containing protein